MILVLVDTFVLNRQMTSFIFSCLFMSGSDKRNLINIFGQIGSLVKRVDPFVERINLLSKEWTFFLLKKNSFK